MAVRKVYFSRCAKLSQEIEIGVKKFETEIKLIILNLYIA